MTEDEGTYEILSGHNRVNAAKIAGLTKVPVHIKKDLTDEEAALIVTETNLVQRSFADLSHSERAIALKSHMTAISKQGNWNGGMDGVRVSVINITTGATMGTPVDYTNKSPSLKYHFGKINKLQYKNGTSLSPSTSAYQYKNPSPALPPIILTSSNGANVEAIKRYFCTDGAARMIAADFGISFETLTNGNYKLLLEPIAYFVFQGSYVGMTAHEAALYDQQLSGGLRSKMASLSHQNLPLAMFLERPDLGFSAYSGSTTGRQSNDTIIAYLGMGTVTYNELEDPPEPSEYDIEYRINTEVITSVTLNASKEINPDAPATVTFNVGGRTYTMSNIVIPEGESQVVWCKWTTPATEQIVKCPPCQDTKYRNHHDTLGVIRE